MTYTVTVKSVDDTTPGAFLGLNPVRDEIVTDFISHDGQGNETWEITVLTDEVAPFVEQVLNQADGVIEYEVGF